ncbi:hypothetical protein JRQ81_008405 [Phrynocephalus forsythii]|uniref:Uncharacterized protein n=1 Tax=Phrynocephalus forsythii TaxID=171643 RepID=A0A9Q0Y571_9SAUR|nr:hypothetical protein JRQ81_008405 [Phrynocephalus forsythii]
MDAHRVQSQLLPVTNFPKQRRRKRAVADNASLLQAAVDAQTVATGNVNLRTSDERTAWDLEGAQPSRGSGMLYLRVTYYLELIDLVSSDILGQ